MECACKMEEQVRCQSIRKETRWSTLPNIFRKYVYGSSQVNRSLPDPTGLCQGSVPLLIPEAYVHKGYWKEVKVALAKAEVEKARAYHEQARHNVM